MSATIAWAIGCIALKNVLAENSSAAISQTDGEPAATTSPNATVSTHWTDVNAITSGLRPIPRPHAHSHRPPPTGKPRMPAPALNAAIIAERPNEECAASATIETDQNEKNHRFHRTAMNAIAISQWSRERTTGPLCEPLVVKMYVAIATASTISSPAIARSDRPASSPIL